MNEHNKAYIQLAQGISRQLKKNFGESYRDLTSASREADNNARLKKLYAIERKILKEIVGIAGGRQAYEKFIDMLLESNLLSGQIYYRERQPVYKKQMISHIKKRNIDILSKYHGNYNLINYLINNWTGKVPDNIMTIYNEFLNIRNTLIENNLPLAINHAKIYYNRMPKGQIQFLDMIGIAVNGLINGVDKYKQYGTSKFLQVCIGRILSIIMYQYNQTMIYLYPKDKKILYKINIIKNKHKITSLEGIWKKLNEQLKQDKADGKTVITKSVSIEQLYFLMTSSNMRSIDHILGGVGQEDNNLYVYLSDGTQNIEEDCMKRDELMHVYNTIKHLDILERKLVRLKGVLR